MSDEIAKELQADWKAYAACHGYTQDTKGVTFLSWFVQAKTDDRLSEEARAYLKGVDTRHWYNCYDLFEALRW